jgi:hypothetical protein
MQPTKFFSDLATRMLGFIGKKFDELKEAYTKPQTVEVKVDVGSSTKDFRAAAESLKSLVAGMESWGSDAEKAAKGMACAEEYFVVMAKALKDTQKAMEKFATSTPSALSTDTKNALLSVVKAIQEMDRNIGRTLSNNSAGKAAETLLKSILEEVSKDRDAGLMKIMGEIAAGLQSLKRPDNSPKVFKLDEMQLRQLVFKGVSQAPSAITGGGAPTNGVLYSGRKVVATLNTAVALAAANTLCEEVFITALPENTDDVVIGGPSVVYTLATRTGHPLSPGGSITLKIRDLSKVYLNGKATEGVTFAYTA